MILGVVSADGVPTIALSIAGQDWSAIIDTGFNGDLELPNDLRDSLNARYVGRVTSALAGGQILEEDVYLVEFLWGEATLPSGGEKSVRLVEGCKTAVQYLAASKIGQEAGLCTQ